jgi:AcrR family transcriptional regulator
MESKNVEKIVVEAKKVFLRYGFKRTTMADLAEAAQMSRPALYLVFPSKEEVFIAVAERFIAEMLEEVRQGIPPLKTAPPKLKFAFEVWYVRPFELIKASPDACDLFESKEALIRAKANFIKAKADFEAIVADVLKPLVREQSGIKLTASKIAEILCSAAHGFKETANNATELRQMLDDHLTLVLAGLGRRKE